MVTSYNESEIPRDSIIGSEEIRDITFGKDFVLLPEDPKVKFKANYDLSYREKPNQLSSFMMSDKILS